MIPAFRSIGLGLTSLVVLSAAAHAADSADDRWKELEPMLRGPKERPKTQDEVKEVFKKFLSEFDAKAEAFKKDFPTDARRWQLVLQDIQTNGMRGMLGLPKKTDEEINKIAEELLSAPDADAKSKGTVSFYRVSNLSNSPKFAELAAEHMKAYPEFPGNARLESMLKAKAAEKEVMAKPIDIKFTALDGKEVNLEAMRGKVVLVDFWATWCGPCVAEMPKVISAYEKLHAKGFEIVGISFDEDKSALEKFTKEKAMPWPQFFDGKGWKNEFGAKYGINSIPRMWLVNKKGMVVDTNGRENLVEKVEKLLAE